jgi:predicted signal transduction protein with EAL and GGDEF domain
MGGDEFVIVDPQVDRAPRDWASLVTEAIERPFELAPGLLVSVGASVGFTTVAADDLDVDQVLRRADLAMYAVKREKAPGEPVAAVERPAS